MPIIKKRLIDLPAKKTSKGTYTTVNSILLILKYTPIAAVRMFAKDTKQNLIAAFLYGSV
jgi:hypothetical protein